MKKINGIHAGKFPLFWRECKPDKDTKWHQQLTENVSVRQLVSRCYEVIGMAKTYKNIRELKQRVAEHYGKKPVQFTMYF